MRGKTLIIIFMLLIVLSGCSFNKAKPLLNEQNANMDYNNFNSNEVIGRINDIKNGLTPKVKPTGKNSATGESGQNGQDEQQKVQLENLTAQYNRAIIKTNLGDIDLEFYSQESPITVNNFLNLAKVGFYNGVKFHRVIKDFMIQGGDPLSKDGDSSNDGTGGPGYRFQDEINSHKLVRGSLAMANSGPNTNGSQFFIVAKEATPWLDGKHTNFGYVIGGMDTIDKIEAAAVDENDRPLDDIIIESVELVSGSAEADAPIEENAASAEENFPNAEAVEENAPTEEAEEANTADRGEEDMATTSEDNKQ